jgi:orotidine-5'-phosphate decarboxylase
MTFLKKLRTIQRRQKSLLCVGLDPDPSLLPTHLPRTADGIIEFNRHIIEATHDLVCAYKLNLAFYEALGIDGWRVLQETLRCVPRHLVTIGDGKRGDIGNTSERYAAALFGDLNFDAITVHPYMGYDSLEPFLRDSSRGVFILALTSNKGSGDFQRLLLGGRPLYEKVIQTALKWNEKKNIGFVIGATNPDELEPIREQAPSVPLLIPGVGSQGGDVLAAVRYGCTKQGDLAVINSGRSILYASREKDFAHAARREARRLRAQMERIRSRFFPKRNG